MGQPEAAVMMKTAGCNIFKQISQKKIERETN